jgi:hypothetical protein
MHTFATDYEDAFYKDKGSQRMTLMSMNKEKRWSFASLNP